MKAIWELLNQAGAERLGWIILHSLWQGAIITVLFALIRVPLRRYSAHARYLVSCAMLLGIALGPVLTAFHGPLQWGGQAGGYTFNGRGPGYMSPPAWSGPQPGSHLAAVASVWLAQGTRVLELCVPWTVAAWVVGVVIFCSRSLHGLWWLKRMRTVEVAPVEARWVAVLEYLKCRFGIRRKVWLVQSALAEVPMVVGWFKPVILLPASTLSGLTPEQLEAILAHELAHLHRCDDLVNAFQNVLEILLFYHPGVWWISRCIREEREHCCDDLVLEICQDRLTYARALFRLEELRGTQARLAFAASGGPLLERIRRLVGSSPAAWPVTGREFSGLALLALGCVLMLAGGILLLGPETYVGTARIRIEREGMLISPMTPAQGSSGSYDPYFIQTEFEVLQSQLILEQVIAQLNLTREWGKKSSRALRPADTIELLRSQMALRPVRNTSIIEIRVYDDNAAEAALIANTIANTYAGYRSRKQSQATPGTETLMARLKEQDALIAGAQAKVDRLTEELKLNDSAGPDGSVRLSAEALRKMESVRLESQGEYIRSKTLLEKLRELKPDELPQAISTTGIPDSNLNALLEQQNIVEQKLVATQKEFGPQHNDVIKLTAQAEDLKQRIQQRTDGILRGLEARVSSLQQGLNDLSNVITKATQAESEPIAASGRLSQAKRDLEEQEQFRQVLLAKIASERTETKPPRDSGVEIVDQAFPASRPSSPNRPRSIALMGGGALLCLLGLGLVRSGRSRVSAQGLG